MKKINELASGQDESGTVNISEVMAQFQCHKVVHAAVIKLIGSKNENGDLNIVIGLPGDDVDIPYIAKAEMIARHDPSCGDYVVLYDNDYVSISPKEVFEAGYSEITYENLGDEDNEIYIPTTGVDQITSLAEVCHGVLQQYAKPFGHELKAWAELDNKEQQHYIGRIAQYMLYPDAKVSAPHDAWSMRMKLNGWKYGAELDANKLTHPNIIDFEIMEPEQQAQDYIIYGLVKETLNR
ncbi:hypothetical protein [uncultured Psychrosphaera sp.]|uniref:hypothetical protein n=1 Tax=uncultured Psychrosphaera sp. TaxID=1403522 RepID=UPI0026206564|nr:hypothetical protein [uncultured Psychrosphaera sp.]